MPAEPRQRRQRRGPDRSGSAAGGVAHGGTGGGPGHDHVHGRRVRARLGHWLAELVGTHAHDAADQVDSALEADADGRRALFGSLGILGATAAVELVVVAFSGSVALLGDGLHNVADALTAVPLLLAFGLARRPPSKRYTYGLGRVEDLGGLFVIAMIALSSVLAGWEAIDRLVHPHRVGDLWAVAMAAVVGFAGNEMVARYRIRVGRRIGSAALVADGVHARTDGFTSLAVLIGAAGVALGWRPADPAVGLVITVAILGVLRSAARQVGGRLLDAVDPTLVDRVAAAVQDVPGVVGIEDLRVRWVGHTLRAEIGATVEQSLTLVEAHDVAHRTEARLLTSVARLASASVHVSPAGAHQRAALDPTSPRGRLRSSNPGGVSDERARRARHHDAAPAPSPGTSADESGA